tara:strand:+ start:8092 stop:8271 length:180 start_codon:yes stop_codon:yes gene_type:complete
MSDKKTKKKVVTTYSGVAKKQFRVEGKTTSWGEVFETTDKKVYDLLINTKRIEKCQTQV